jgi:hypothetical protein
VHGLRHTYATELATSEVSVYTLMKLLGHESMATSQRYVAGAARETRTAAAQNPLYGVIHDRFNQPEKPDGDSHRPGVMHCGTHVRPHPATTQLLSWPSRRRSSPTSGSSGFFTLYAASRIWWGIRTAPKRDRWSQR